jgi:hypothetical protein
MRHTCAQKLQQRLDRIAQTTDGWLAVIDSWVNRDPLKSSCSDAVLGGALMLRL